MATETTPAPATPAVPSTWHFHVWYLVILALLIFGGHAWMQEHDARVLAEANLKVNASTVQMLQKQIAANDEQTAAQIKSLQDLITTVKTPIQVVQALPKVTTIPLPVPPTVLPDNSIDFPEADVLPLFKDLEQGKEDAVALTSCKSDLANEKEIAVNQATEITTLQKKPKFWKRVAHDVKVSTGTAAVVVIVAAILIH